MSASGLWRPDITTKHLLLKFLGERIDVVLVIIRPLAVMTDTVIEM